jgi:hypothetical protein
MSLRKPTTQAQENRLLHVLRVGDSELIRSRLSMMNNSGNDAGNALPDFHAQEVGGSLARRVFGTGNTKWSDESVTAESLNNYFKTQVTKNFNLRNAESTVTFKHFKQLTMKMTVQPDTDSGGLLITGKFLEKTVGQDVQVGGLIIIKTKRTDTRRLILDRINAVIFDRILKMKSVASSESQLPPSPAPSPLGYTTDDLNNNLEFGFDDQNQKNP